MKLSERIRGCSEGPGDFEDWAAAAEELEAKNEALKTKLGMCEMALRVAHLELPPYDALLTGVQDE